MSQSGRERRGTRFDSWRRNRTTDKTVDERNSRTQGGHREDGFRTTRSWPSSAYAWPNLCSCYAVGLDKPLIPNEIRLARGSAKPLLSAKRPPKKQIPIAFCDAVFIGESRSDLGVPGQTLANRSANLQPKSHLAVNLPSAFFLGGRGSTRPQASAACLQAQRRRTLAPGPPLLPEVRKLE